MKVRALLLATVLLMPASALADPITVGGSWSNVGTPVGDESSALLSPFWSGLSWDCAECGIGYMINAFGNEQIEYLHDGFGQATGFRFAPDDPITIPVYLGGITGWTNGTFGRRADGAFTYDSGTGHVSNSWDNGAQYALFRIVGAESTQYFLGIEDILVSYSINDHDHNDYIVSFTQTNAVPEPTSLLLMGLGFAGFVTRKRLQQN